jgi:hypothetical protein
MQSWFFLVVSLAFNEEFQRVNDLRQLPEKRMACALQIAKPSDYSPKHGLSGAPVTTRNFNRSNRRRAQTSGFQGPRKWLRAGLAPMKPTRCLLFCP